MGFVFFVLVLVGWLILYSRLRRAENRLDQERYERSQDGERIAHLTRRIWALEKSQTATVPSIPAAMPVEALAKPPAPEVSADVVSEPPSVVFTPPEPQPTPVPVLAAPEHFRSPAPPQRTWRDQLRDSMGGQEWEAVVGGSWLNKLGVLVLVIGIALLLGYEFTHVGPAGRVAIGIAAGLTMLLSGVFIERKSAYAIFATASRATFARAG